jgi:hypothetical protein
MEENLILKGVGNVPEKFSKAAEKLNSLIELLQPSIEITKTKVLTGRRHCSDPVRIGTDYKQIEGIHLEFIARYAGEESFDIVVSMLFAGDLFPVNDSEFRSEFPAWGYQSPIRFVGDKGRKYAGFETYFGTQEEINPAQAADLITKYLDVAANYYGLGNPARSP